MISNHETDINDGAFNPYNIDGQPMVMVVQNSKTEEGYQVKGNLGNTEEKCSEHSHTHT